MMSNQQLQQFQQGQGGGMVVRGGSSGPGGPFLTPNNNPMGVSGPSTPSPNLQQQQQQM